MDRAALGSIPALAPEWLWDMGWAGNLIEPTRRVCECAPNRDPTAECANYLTRNTNSTPREGSRQMQNETPQESQIILFDQCLQRFSAWDPGSVKNHIYAAVCAKGSAEHRLGGRCLGAPQPAYMARNSISSAYGGAARR